METTRDGWLGGRLLLQQPRRGYRAGVDAALLAAACDVRRTERVLEVGCGVGAVVLAIARRRAVASLVGLERDRELAGLARANVAANDLQDVIAIATGDVEDGFVALERPPFDHALANPPFFDNPAALRGPTAERRGAWIADVGLGAWIDFMVAAVRDGGTLTLIHRAERLADVLAGMGARAGGLKIRPIQPFADAPAKRILVRAVKGSRGALVLLPALILHPAGAAKHTLEAEAILRGEAALDWD